MSLLLIILAGCSPGARDPSVLLITLDTTRADRLGSYGYALAQTPTLDALAAQGTRFERAYTNQPMTIPAHSSIMTGRAPPSHGVRDNGDALLGEGELTLAERFAEAGYHTTTPCSACPTSSTGGTTARRTRWWTTPSRA